MTLLLFWTLKHYHPSRVLTLVYQPFAFGTIAILAYNEAKIDTRWRNIRGYSLFFISTVLLIVVSNSGCCFLNQDAHITAFKLKFSLLFGWLSDTECCLLRFLLIFCNSWIWPHLEKEGLDHILLCVSLSVHLELLMPLSKVGWLEISPWCVLNSSRFVFALFSFYGTRIKFGFYTYLCMQFFYKFFCHYSLLWLDWLLQEL